MFKSVQELINFNDDQYRQNYLVWGDKPSFIIHKNSDLIINFIRDSKDTIFVLDIGCGEGRDSFFYARLGCDVTSVDLSSVAINKLNALAKKMHLDNVNAKCLEIHSFLDDSYKRNMKFDIIHCVFCLQFQNKPDVLIEKVKRLLKSGGLIVFSIFAARNEIEKKNAYKVGYYFFEKGEFENHFLENGFDVLSRLEWEKEDLCAKDEKGYPIKFLTYHFVIKRKN